MRPILDGINRLVKRLINGKQLLLVHIKRSGQ